MKKMSKRQQLIEAREIANDIYVHCLIACLIMNVGHWGGAHEELKSVLRRYDHQRFIMNKKKEIVHWIVSPSNSPPSMKKLFAVRDFIFNYEEKEL
jgi:hypothetical protein